MLTTQPACLTCCVLVVVLCHEAKEQGRGPGSGVGVSRRSALPVDVPRGACLPTALKCLMTLLLHNFKDPHNLFAVRSVLCLYLWKVLRPSGPSASTAPLSTGGSEPSTFTTTSSVSPAYTLQVSLRLRKVK